MAKILDQVDCLPYMPLLKPDEFLPTSGKSFSRDNFLEILNKLTCDIKGPISFALEGSWGSGKTHLLLSWKQQLKAENRPHIYYNAWENDNEDDPFISFIGALSEEFSKQEITWGKVIDKAIPVLAHFIPIGIKMASRAALNKVGVDKEVLKLADFSNFLADQIQEYQSNKQKFSDFKYELQCFAEQSSNTWLDNNSGVQQKPPPLIIIVDELDRCRPDYAILLLERIKHLFAVEHIVFVFSIAMDQLKETVCSLYGNNIDSDGYLRKFFNYKIPMPPADYHQNLHYCKELIHSLGMSDGPSTTLDEIVFQFFYITYTLGLSLREQEQAIISCRIVAIFSSNPFWNVICLLVAIKLKYRTNYIAFKNKKLSLRDGMQMMNLTHEWPEHFYKDMGLLYSLLLSYSVRGDNEFNRSLSEFVPSINNEYLKKLTSNFMFLDSNKIINPVIKVIDQLIA